jgi:hypothetical protein
VFVAMEIGSRRILHLNVTDHPTAEWTIQQFREVLADSHPYDFVIHDRDSIFSPSLDSALTHFGVRVMKTPVRAPKAKAYASHCTSSARCGTISTGCRLFDILTPMAFRGGLSPGCSYRQSFLPL